MHVIHWQYKTYGSFSPLLGTKAFPKLSFELLSFCCRLRFTGSENASPSIILLNFWSKYPAWSADLVLLPPGSICFPLWAATLKSVGVLYKEHSHNYSEYFFLANTLLITPINIITIKFYYLLIQVWGLYWYRFEVSNVLSTDWVFSNGSWFCFY